MPDETPTPPRQTRTAGRKSPMLSITMPPEYWDKLRAIEEDAPGIKGYSAVVRYLIDKEHKALRRNSGR